MTPSRLREDLAAAGFTAEGVEALLGSAACAALRRDQTAPARRVLEGDGSPLAVLVRLCTLAAACPVAEVERALPRTGVAGLVDLGLARSDGSEVWMSHDVSPYADEAHDWWLVSDLAHGATAEPLKPDHVLGVGPASTTLASWTPRPPVRDALDLGTGCGVQALHLDSHAAHVVATDVSSRALAMAGLNASLAGAQWDLRQGDLFAPVAGEAFDLVVSNPPFVIGPVADPEDRLVYRDGGRRGDGFLEELVRGLPDHLTPGGVATLIGNWAVRRAEDWQQRWRDWIGVPHDLAPDEPPRSGSTPGVDRLDAWVVCRDVVDTAQYTETWLRDGGMDPSGEAWEVTYRRWLDEFDALGVDRVALGIIVLQRPLTARAAWADLELVEGPVDTPMGPHVLAGLRARTWLAEHRDEDLLGARWLCADDVTVERHARPLSPAGEVLCVRQGGGMRRHRVVDPVTVALLGVSDGDLTAGQALTAIAAVMGEDQEAVRGQGLVGLRRLVADGMLVRAETTGE